MPTEQGEDYLKFEIINNNLNIRNNVRPVEEIQNTTPVTDQQEKETETTKDKREKPNQEKPLDMKGPTGQIIDIKI